MHSNITAAIAIVVLSGALLGCNSESPERPAPSAKPAVTRTSNQTISKQFSPETLQPSPRATASVEGEPEPGVDPLPGLDPALPPIDYAEPHPSFDFDMLPYRPQVVLSDEHAATCLVGVGDTMPDIAFHVQDEVRHLHDCLGRLTLVVFWNRDRYYAVEQFSRLGREVRDRYGDLGLSIVAVNVVDPAQAAPPESEPAARPFVSGWDDGSAFSQVATARIPRTYLLDSTGTIVWFDLEYSRSTRREMHNAIRYYLKNPQ